jgi:hypothetical protein
MVVIQELVPKQDFHCEGSVVKWLGQPLWISYECFTFLLIGVSVWPHMGCGDDCNMEYIREMIKKNTSNRGLFSKYLEIWQCDRSLLCYCKLLCRLGSSHWWGSVISENVLTFVPWRITIPKKFILKSIYVLRNFGSFCIFKNMKSI